MRLADLAGAKTTIYLTGRSGKARISGASLVCGTGAEETACPLGRLRRLVLIGNPDVSLAVLRKCLGQGIAIDWLDRLGRTLGQWLGAHTAYAPCIDWQMAWNKDAALSVAREYILAKLDNCHEAIRRRTQLGEEWHKRRSAIAASESAASLRGHEGIAARMYFASWQEMIRPFQWTGRHPRPAPDPVNMLLSFGYAQLRNRLASALAASGLDPRLGFFHETRGSHCALASDLMEPLRALVDTRVLAMIRLREISPADFRMRGEVCVCANSLAFAKILSNWEEMFAARHSFYLWPGSDDKEERSLNDMLDDMAECFAGCVREGREMIVPRLAPCAIA